MTKILSFLFLFIILSQLTAGAQEFMAGASVRIYDYVSRTSLGEMTGEIYVDEVVKWMGQMESADAKK